MKQNVVIYSNDLNVQRRNGYKSGW